MSSVRIPEFVKRTPAKPGWHPRSEFLALPTGKVHVIDSGGHPDRMPVLLLHGYVMSSWAWRMNIEALAASHRVIAMCHKGFGFSEKPRSDYRLESLAECVFEVLDTLKVQRCMVVGHSMGGAIAMRMAIERPERIDRLALVCSAGIRWQLPRVLTSLPMPLLVTLSRALFSRPLMKRILRTVGYWKPVVDEVYMDTYMRALQSPGFAYAAMKTAEEFSGSLSRLHEEISTIQQRSLLIWGRHDRILPVRVGEILHQMLPESKLVVMEDVGHCPNEENAEEFNQLVLDFMDGSGTD